MPGFDQSDPLMNGLTAESARAQLKEIRCDTEQFRALMQRISGDIRSAITGLKQGHAFIHIGDEFFRGPAIDELRRRGFQVEVDDRQRYGYKVSW